MLLDRDNMITEPMAYSSVTLESLATDVLRHASVPLNGDGNPAVRQHVQTLCRVARYNGLPVERVLIVLKDAWYVLPEFTRPRADKQREVLDAMVTLCIEEYYAETSLNDPGSRCPSAERQIDCAGVIGWRGTTSESYGEELPAPESGQIRGNPHHPLDGPHSLNR